MTRLKIGKTIDAQLTDQGFQHHSSEPDLRAVAEEIIRYASFSPLLKDGDMFISPSHVVGLKGKGYELYKRPNQLRKERG